MDATKTWPTAMYTPQRTGFVQDTCSPPLRVRWTYHLGHYVWGHPLIVDDTVYLTGPALLALDLHTGARIWQTEPIGSTDINAPALWDDLLVVGGSYGLFLIHRQTGQTVYRRPANLHSATPTVHHGQVYWADTRFYVSDIRSGAIVRTYAAGGYRCVAALQADHLYMNSATSVFALNTLTGAIVWQRAFPERAVQMLRGMAIDAERLIVPTATHGIFALNPQSGALHWHVNNIYSDTRVSVADRVIYIAGGKLYALDSTTGAHIWVKEQIGPEKYSPALGLCNSAPIVVGDHLYIGGGLDANVYCFDRHTGDIRWHYQTGGMVFSTPSYANGCLVIGSHDGFVYCFEQA